MLEDGKFIQQAVKEGVTDIVASYNAAIDKFVADPDVRLAIKMSAGSGILQRLFERLKGAAGQEEAGQEPSKETDPHVWPFGDLSGWTTDQY